MSVDGGIEEKRISRRSFLKAATLLTAGGVMSAVELNIASKGRLFNLIGKTIEEAPDIIKARQESKIDHFCEQVMGTESIETVENNDLFIVLRPKIWFGNKTTRWVHDPVLTFFKPRARAVLENVPNGKREILIETIQSPVFLGPIGNVTGDYDRNLIDPGVNLNTLFPSRVSSGQRFGPQRLVDRFPGFGDDVNKASGGIVIRNGVLNIVNRDGLVTEVATGSDPFFQSVYYFDESNTPRVLKESWQVHKQKFVIGNTHFFYAAYFQIKLGREPVSGFIVNDKSTMALSNFIRTVASMSDGGSYKIALVDGGNGSSAFIRCTDNQVKVFGRNGSDDHLIPFTVKVGI